jgi:hypothetical protein
VLRSLVLVLGVVGCAQSTTLASDASDASADAPVSRDAGRDEGIDGGRDVGIDVGADAACQAVVCSVDGECDCFGRRVPGAIGCCDTTTGNCFATRTLHCPPIPDSGPRLCGACTSSSSCHIECFGGPYECIGGVCQPTWLDAGAGPPDVGL